MLRIHHLAALAAASFLMAPEGVHGGDPGMIGYSGQKTMVHMAGHEGVLIIDTFSGLIYPASIHADGALPDWATERNLVSANLAERVIWYGKRLSPEQALAVTRSPDALAFEDLSWMVLNEPLEGETQPTEGTLEADDEYRMDNLAKLLVSMQINRDPDAAENFGSGVDAQVHVASDRTRDKADLDALEEAQQGRMAATGTGE